MALIPARPKTWSAGEVLTHTDLNGEVDNIRDAVNASGLFKDVTSQTVTVAVTFSAAQTFSAGITVTGAITMASTASQLVPGATSFAVRNTANSADNLLVTDAGAVTVRAGLTITASGLTVTAGGATITAGNLTVTAGNLIFSGATAKLIPGVTSFSLRNNADSADNILITDAGAITLRATLTGTTLSMANATVTVNTNATGTSIATTSSDKFLILSRMSGAPTNGSAPLGSLVLDDTNNALYVKTTAGWLSVTVA